MELKVNEYQLPEALTFNYEELKAALVEKTEIYKVMVYSDDQIAQAKKDRADLNRLKKALNDERLRREKEYMEPFNEFKKKINEIIAIIDQPAAVIDKQVKGYEEKKKQEKKDEIAAFFTEMEHPDWLQLAKIWDEKWLNTTASMKSVQEALTGKVAQVTTDLTTLASLPEFGFEATEVYKSTLDINRAISEGHRLAEIARKKAEYEATQAARLAEQMAAEQAAREESARMAEIQPVKEEEITPVEEVLPQIEPVRSWIAFKANLTIDEALELREFFTNRSIEFKAV